MTLLALLEAAERANAAFTEYANDPWMVEGATREQRHGQLEAAYLAARDALIAEFDRLTGIPGSAKRIAALLI